MIKFEANMVNAASDTDSVQGSVASTCCELNVYKSKASVLGFVYGAIGLWSFLTHIKDGVLHFWVSVAGMTARCVG